MFSRKRSVETLADYAVVAISPVLIMLMVGSLVFFLIQVFYQGEFNARLCFVMAMFVMGTVAVARISMEESAGYAAPFGAALGAVVFIALLRFVEFTGPLASVSPMISLLLMGVVWWSANQLTWDCTLIEGRKDTSGQGLLKRLWRSAPKPTANPEPVKSGPQPLVEPRESNWWQDWFSLGTKVHTPGLWVAYFAIAAIPLFGIGNLFLGERTLEMRRYTFQLLVTYVASAMGLLVTTSFLNIRRYLRQRNLEMPVSMTARWLGLGLVMGLGILVVCLILPRRNPEYSVTQLRWAQIQITSPARKASVVGVGPEGAKGNSGSATPPTPDSSKDAGGISGNQSGDKSAPPSDPSGKSPGGDSGKGSSGAAASGEKGSTGEKSKDGANGGEAKGSNDNQPFGGEKPKGDGTSSSKEGSSAEKNSSGKESGAGAGEKGKPDEGKGGKGTSGGEQPKQGAGSNTTQKPPENPQSQERPPAPSSGSNSSQMPPPPAPPPAPSRLPSMPTFTLGGAMQGLFYLLVAIGVLVLAYYFRAELAQAWQQFLTEWRAFWAYLMGGKAAAKASEAEPVRAAAPPRRRFSEYASPFNAQGCTLTPEALVRYEFEALEAWGADRGLPRKTEQTPQEYVEQMALLFPGLAPGLQLLGELYSQVAYARRAPAEGPSVANLGKLWQQLQSNY